jgi:hypothetical protein
MSAKARAPQNIVDTTQEADQGWLGAGLGNTVLAGMMGGVGGGAMAGGAAGMLLGMLGSSSDSSDSSSSEGSDSSSTSAPPAEGTAPEGTAGAGPRSTDAILRDYQVREDTMTEWSPQWVGWLTNQLGITEPKTMTQTEADLLDQLQDNRGIVGLNTFKGTRDDAYAVSETMFQENDEAGLPGAEDGHQDAFRHIYWNVLMSRRIGEDFATSFGTAHEGVPGNPADREAMDLYNNELGRRIARENPDATEEELQQIIMESIRNGEAVVINRSGELVFSNEANVGETGAADDPARDGNITPPEWSASH